MGAFLAFSKLCNTIVFFPTFIPNFYLHPVLIGYHMDNISMFLSHLTLIIFLKVLCQNTVIGS